MPTTLVRPGRPRSAEADHAIREATLELLGELGYADLTMSGIAAAAGVSSATLYRRWRSKQDLVIDVLKARSEEHPVPDTGSLYGDLRVVVDATVETLSGGSDHRSVMSALISEIARNPELGQVFRATLVAPRRAAWRGILERADKRGELRTGIDFDIVPDLLSGPFYARLLISGKPITRSFGTEITDLAFHAIASPRALKAHRT